MPTSPNKHKVFKSSGKIFRNKDKERNASEGHSRHSSGSQGNTSNGSSGTNGNNGNGNTTYTSIRKDEVLDLKDMPLTLPDVTPLDTEKSLPRYNGLACGEGVSLEEVDGLQLELELLLSSIMVRQVVLQNQLGVISQLEKGRLPPKQAASPGKRIGQGDGDRPFKKVREMSGKGRDPLLAPGPPPGLKPPKVKCSVIKNEPLFDVPDIGPVETPKPSPVKNDISNRFWQMTDQYCQEITAENVKMLEDFLNAQSDDSEYMKIPPLGKHYSLRWAQEDLLEEQKEGAKLATDAKKAPKSKSDTNDINDKLLKEVNGSNDDVAPMGPLTQRIVSGLVEENVLMTENIENKVQGVGVGRPGFVKSLGLANVASLEKRIKKELQEQGIIDLDGTNEEDDDEILSELKRCQAELKAVSSHNHSQLSRLLQLAREALVRHDLKKKLRDADAKVLEMHRNISGMKQKKKIPTKKDKETSIKILKDREVIVRHLDLLAGNSST